MKRRLSLLALLAVAACQDVPQPLGPSGPQAARLPEQARAWFAQASPEALAVPGAVFADLNETTNRLEIGVEHAAAARGVHAVLQRLGIPGEAYSVLVVPAIHHAATLRDVFRPTIGGIQIHFGQYVCTLGFNATHDASGERSFITNSHCTDRQGGTEGTLYYQPSSSASGVIAREVDDPRYFKGGACPRGRQCRYSDSSRARYEGTTLSSLGVLARTTAANNGDLTTSGTFTVAGEGSANVGTVVNKVGRTTGWTQGKVTRTCTDTNVSGSNITQLCQTFVSAGVAGGDSGSPVFTESNGSATLVGILWGGSSDNSTFVFSPLNQVERELGGLTVR